MASSHQNDASSSKEDLKVINIQSPTSPSEVKDAAK